MENKYFFDFISLPGNSNVVQAHATDTKVDKFKLIKGNYQGVEFPIVFKQKYGNKLFDLLDTGFAGFFLISENMRILLEKNKLTGWKVFPVKLYDKKDNEIMGYHGFSVIGECGPTSYEKSEIIEKRFIPDGPLCKYYKGINFDNWDGSDFFTPKDTYETFITKKAADVLRKNKISNLYLRNLSEIEIKTRYVNNENAGG